MFTGTTMEILRQALDVLVVAFIMYQVLSATRGTRTAQVLVLLLMMAVLYLISQERLLDLPTFRWLLDKFWSVLFLLVVVVYQDDIRRGLGKFRFMDSVLQNRREAPSRVLEEVVKAARSMSAKRIGGLMVLERTADLSPYLTESGIRLDALVSKELLFALFMPDHENPTHDGAVILKKNRVAAAGVILPLTMRPEVEAWVGTRHRAAMGISERVDAAVVVVSEETGRISVALEGELKAGLSVDDLRELLLALFGGGRKQGLFKRLRRRSGGKSQ